MSLLLFWNRRRRSGGPALLPGSGQTLPRVIAIRSPSRIFAYRAQGGISAGGAAETSMERAPARVYAFRGQARVRIGGQASVTYFDMGAHIRRLDDELLLLT